MSRAQQDTFIDDTEESCPLCVEEFDLSDRNFKPCPCGYQICQFCFNNIRTNLNGLCPACRRPYDDSTIEYKVISPDEYKAEAQKKTRLNAERRQREAQKREIEAQNRKHLAGLRVIQKNLVYVVGLNPRIKEEDLLQTLRGEQYFGQYGKIVKIVVNKRTAQDPAMASYNDSGKNSGGMGVYVTFARKQDAETCIAAVDGSVNGDRVLRATYGTTKYCSAYLRNETCPNKNCMFLHEPGEEAESFSRLDLSSINATGRCCYNSSPSNPATSTCEK
ncbi:RING/Ubox like zinc-binding domain-containing protein [Terfezia claveryi]|nr:RING/Ubox like zinc-binding domain-containing protein [Terfezia claveryi]